MSSQSFFVFLYKITPIQKVQENNTYQNEGIKVNCCPKLAVEMWSQVAAKVQSSRPNLPESYLTHASFKESGNFVKFRSHITGN